MFNFFRAVPKKRNVRVNKSKGLVFSNPSKGRKFVFHIGNLLLLGAIVYGGYLYTPLISALYKYKFTRVEVKNEQVASQSEEAKESKEYIIQIPKILAYSRVIENVSPFDEAEYTRVLRNNVVAQTKDSDIPGSGVGKMVYIFAHSSDNDLGKVRNNAVFYLLGELQIDDLVYLNYHGQEIKYKVFEKKVVGPTELKYLSYQDENREVLILQTCWPIGTDWNRLLILAERI